MSRRSLIVLVILGTALFALLLVVSRPIKPTERPSSLSALAAPLERQEQNEGEITVSVQPKNISSENAVWEFEIGLETHSVELDADLAANSVLVLENGKTFRAVGWQGDPPGGHHRNGVLRFDRISPMPKRMQLILERIGSVERRNFIWSL